LDALLQYRLSQEKKEVRRLIWILQVKQPSLTRSKVRRRFNLKRDKQIIILKDKGYDRKLLHIIADTYECGLEMFQ